jgi:hypothetical protein
MDILQRALTTEEMVLDSVEIVQIFLDKSWNACKDVGEVTHAIGEHIEMLQDVLDGQVNYKNVYLITVD